MCDGSRFDLIVRPSCRAWPERLARDADGGPLFGHAMPDWRAKTRRELGLADDRPVIATGHQTLLWHPGILVKYMLADTVARAHGLARANLIVDQHAAGGVGTGDFGAYDVPVRRASGGLGIRRIELTKPRPHVPMALHEPFAPAPPPARLAAALPSVAAGVTRIHAAIDRHRGAPDAARQMALALDDLMQPWVAPAPSVTASDLLETSLARAVLGAMAADPARCAEAYNAAVDARPEAGIGRLLVRDDYVETPLWRIRPDGRRMHAYDNDVASWVETGEPRLMPRALLLTALLRLGMCDLFVHGLGGAAYDRAMEGWIERWLGARPAPIAVASATVRLPLLDGADDPPPDVAAAIAAARRTWHDPESPDEPEGGRAAGTRPGPAKRELLEAVDRAERRSPRRRAAFLAMHRQLETLRSANAGRVERLQRRAEEARRRRADGAIAGRRDWPFPLYPAPALDALAAEVARAAGAPCPAPGADAD